MADLKVGNMRLMGNVKVPPSKSMAHRAIICASLSHGVSKIENIDFSDDIIATMEAMKALGAKIYQNKNYIEIQGINHNEDNKELKIIDCNESGSTLRFLVPIFLLIPGKKKFIGRGNLGKRPLNTFYEIFEQDNIEYSFEEGILNLQLEGTLKGGEYYLAGNISSQFITGLLFTLPLINRDSKIIITTEMESKGYIDLTLSALRDFGIEIINNDYIDDILKSIIKRGKEIDTQTITEADLKEMIKKYPNEDEVVPLQVLRDKVTARLDTDFKIRNTIVEENMDVYDEVSSGFDAQMYFTLLSGEMRDKGLYIIDQPEDHISQRAIKEKVLDQFRRMGSQRQVIMVTHNPQFIVNLDVDNVIYLSKDKGKFMIQSGALEYENDDYSILKIVADNIEGGLQTIQGRLKRYEKDI